EFQKFVSIIYQIIHRSSRDGEWSWIKGTHPNLPQVFPSLEILQSRTSVSTPGVLGIASTISWNYMRAYAQKLNTSQSSMTLISLLSMPRCEWAHPPARVIETGGLHISLTR